MVDLVNKAWFDVGVDLRAPPPKDESFSFGSFLDSLKPKTTTEKVLYGIAAVGILGPLALITGVAIKDEIDEKNKKK